jgi:hypothetical protein
MYLKLNKKKHISQFKIRKLNITLLTLVLKKKSCMSAYSLLNVLPFDDISFIEIRQEIKLLEHFGIIKDHPVWMFL